uniref:Uncharacterized protein n=1 Tax=Chromera velia CCMP2878 TaxID=1169474 RepID=A0A0G4H8N9_9ALVE|eukprot:Cvel_25217.t1-p1 / transcript=Cvel_25217.t1 / gene=Cvel_25217 / organism=Chromera_velia_CCMP2878 / gene_product=hypothetical protein / transcript_product=hypothetical protein / location=Cvel_scaffold2827:9525-9812(-) / protein_length=96 / sequence_SO=supercontig / SO=protein_coding / is_pseudo=false
MLFVVTYPVEKIQRVSPSVASSRQEETESVKEATHNGRRNRTRDGQQDGQNKPETDRGGGDRQDTQTEGEKEKMGDCEWAKRAPGKRQRHRVTQKE